MTTPIRSRRIQIFSTCPQSKDVPGEVYAQRVAEVARWSEHYDYAGMLIYADNGIADPWTVAGCVFHSTESLCPLIAVQPVYSHPYTIAKVITTNAYLYGRKMYLNMIAGGFKNDLTALNDQTPHDERYQRLTEYTLILRALLESDEPVTFEGDYYTVRNLQLTPQIPAELKPGILISGSSDAGLAAARAIQAVPIKYPQRPHEEPDQNDVDWTDPGVRFGVIARETAKEAWHVAHQRFPENRKGQLQHQLAMKTSDSQWHRQLSELAEHDAEKDDPYWLGPFQNYRTFCPYLVGNYEQVSQVVSDYVQVGYRTFILDIPPCEEELEHSNIVFQTAKEGVTFCQN